MFKIKNPRTYTIDTFETKYNFSKRNYPIYFTEDAPLFASFGTVISVEGVEHMRTQDGWVDAFGGRFTNEEMKDYIIEHNDDSYVLYNPTRTRI